MASPPVTDAERNGYFQFSYQLIAKNLAASPPERLWHYTSGAALIAIIGSGHLWSTQVSCLNDSTELRYAIALLRDAFRLRRRSHTPDADEVFLYECVDDALSNDGAPTSEWFVVSLSAKWDDLSQWRAYGGSEGGYSIAFDTEMLGQLGLPDQRFLARVDYDVQTHDRVVNQVTHATFQHFFAGLAARPGTSREEWAEAFLPVWADAITYIAPILKHPAFHDEAEWRIIRRLRPEDFPNMKYLQKQSMMTRHLPLRYVDAAGLMPILEIYVGPSRHKEISKISIADLLRTHRYPQNVIDNVRASDIPFQSL